MTDGALLPRLAALAREQGDDFPLAEFLEAMDAMANELLVNDEGGSYEVRIIGPDPCDIGGIAAQAPNLGKAPAPA